MKRKLSPWCKEVKKTLIDRDMTVTDLCDQVGMCRNYVSRTINGASYAPALAETISKALLKILILMKIIVAIILTFQMEKQFIRFRISGRFMINVVMNILFCKHWRRQVK